MRPCVLLLIVLIVGACADVRQSPPPATDAAVLLAPANAAPRTSEVPLIYAEVVSTSALRSRGLGGRMTLAADSGMLFVYPRARTRTFWMKDCFIGLDIAFLDAEARVRMIVTLPPGAGKRGADIPSVDCPSPSRFVLETNAGWMERNGLEVGDRVDLAELVRGVEAE